MKERNPERVEGLVLSKVEGLTTASERAYHGNGLNIMAEGQGEIPKGGPPAGGPTPPQPQPGEVRPSDERWLKEQGLELERERREALERGELTVSGGQAEAPTEVRRQIFEDIPEDQVVVVPEVRPADESEETFNRRQEQARNLLAQADAISRADSGRVLNPQEAYQNINNAIARGEIDPIAARPYLDAITARAAEAARERAQEQQFARAPELADVLRIERETEEESRERTEALKELIDGLSPDYEHVHPALLHLIALDNEASEMFLDKIVSKPFAAPEADYRLSFYAEINLQAFFTEVARIARRRHEEYVRKAETALRFHQMNKTIISESGNIDSFVNITRTVTPQHIQTASSEDGVELVRQLIEMAYGRFYAKENRITGDNFDREINQWVDERFRDMAEKGIVKSHFQLYDPTTGEVVRDEKGAPVNRLLEPWETNRALALGKYIHASFYRHSELISWSNIPPEWEEWIKSTPSETVVRVLAGIKWLPYRFRIGGSIGGPEFMALLYDKIRKDDYDKPDKPKPKLNKIGMLDIRKDLLPVRFFRGGGFDRGWRTLTCYLQNDLMQIDIPDPNRLPAEVRNGVRQFIEKYGNRASLGDFLFKQEYVAQRLASERAEIAGAEIPEELRRFSDKKISELMEKLFTKELLDQVNLSLGVLISFSGSNEGLRAKLWKRAADFLPLRIAYLLSEEGVKNPSNCPSYSRFRGENGALLNPEFESKLITAQRLRIEEQKKDPRRPVTLENYERILPDGSRERVNFLDEAGLTELEKAFVRELQDFGRKNAEELGKINFPQIPFLDDVPFHEANYLGVGAETFPRRMGGDFKAFSEANSALINIVNNLAQPYEEILKNLDAIANAMATPENRKTGQDVAFPVLQTYLELVEQWQWSRWIPFWKTAQNLGGFPVSHLQRMFGPNAPADDAVQLREKVRQAAEHAIIRREQLPGEDDSQVDKLLKKVSAKWWNALIDQGKTLSIIILLMMAAEFGKRVTQEKS